MIEKNTIEERVTLVLENLVLQGYEIASSSTFEEMGLDSLDKIELLMDLEDEFLLELPDEAATMIDTFGELVEYITRLTVKK